MSNYTITFATLNCLDYTKKCVESLISSGVDPNQIVAVDNASTDGTPEYLKQLGLGVTLKFDTCGIIFHWLFTKNTRRINMLPNNRI